MKISCTKSGEYYKRKRASRRTPVEHLLLKYGSRASKVTRLIQGNPTWSERLIEKYPYIKAEVIYTARYEMAVTPRDFFARRIRLEITDWQATLACLPEVASLMALELGWDKEQELQHVEEYSAQIRSFQKEAGV